MFGQLLDWIVGWSLDWVDGWALDWMVGRTQGERCQELLSPLFLCFLGYCQVNIVIFEIKRKERKESKNN